MDHKPTICIDFDGVIHHYLKPWTGETDINDPPTPGAMEFLRDMTEHFRVCILSTRSRNPLAVKAIQDWMIDHWGRSAWLDKIEFPTEKPPALIYIDDRAMLFTGVWPTAEQIKAFVPWNKKGDKIAPASGFNQYRRSQIAELRPWIEGDVIDSVSISQPDRENGSPKAGDMIARNPKNHDDQWLVAAKYFSDNFEPM